MIDSQRKVKEVYYKSRFVGANIMLGVFYLVVLLFGLYVSLFVDVEWFVRVLAPLIGCVMVVYWFWAPKRWSVQLSKEQVVIDYGFFKKAVPLESVGIKHLSSDFCRSCIVLRKGVHAVVLPEASNEEAWDTVNRLLDAELVRRMAEPLRGDVD